MKLPVGTRVKHVSGREGVIVRRVDKGKGSRGGVLWYLVRLDGPKVNSFEPEVVRAYGNALTPTAPALHAKWEAEWDAAPFVDRAWARGEA